MTNYKEVFQLAQDKKYLLSDYMLTENGTTDLHPTEEKALIELTLIQKWLRDEHKIAVFVVRASFGHYGYEVYKDIEKTNEADKIKATGFSKMSYSYEISLTDGIGEALKLIP